MTNKWFQTAMRTCAIAVSIASIGLMNSMYCAKPADAQDVTGGKKGPTDWQFVNRSIVSNNSAGLETLANQTIIKYWPGKKHGIYAFAILPYKRISNSTKESSGLGDITLAAGPRGISSSGKIHWISYLGLTMPTGNNKNIPKLGNGKTDFRVGSNITLDMNSYEGDIVLEYIKTGTKKNQKKPDEYNLNVLAGTHSRNKIKLATGVITNFQDNGNYTLASRSVIRYNISQLYQLQLVGDIGFKQKNLPKTNSLSMIVRYNF